ncbi:MAG: DUF1819 family protein [Chloroflexota bacterium]|nr:DUF1819 family protein [Chloroflexota bacterium]
MSSERYLLSFTAASLTMSASIQIAETYLQLRDWDAVKEKVKAENLIQARTMSSLKRMYQELAPRLYQLSDQQLELLVEGTLQEQKQLLWFAICKRYAYIRDFAVEVIHEKFLSLDHELTDLDYDAFYNRKVDWHPELDQIAKSTQQKMKTRIFWMLKEAGLTTEEGAIVPTMMSTRLMESLKSDPDGSLQVFPIPPFDLPK